MNQYVNPLIFTRNILSRMARYVSKRTNLMEMVGTNYKGLQYFMTMFSEFLNIILYLMIWLNLYKLVV